MLDASFVVLMNNPDEFFKVFTKMKAEDLPKQFGIGLKPNQHVMTLEDGSQVSIKFIDAIKKRIDSKLKVIPGKESFMSGYEISVKPVGQKAYARMFNLSKILCTAHKVTCVESHAAKLENLKNIAAQYGISLTEESWSRVYFDPRKKQ